MDRQAYLALIDQVIARGPFQDNWDSLAEYRIPEWYRSAKFGIFIHWGVYSVPAFSNEWYPRCMYIQGTKEYEHHLKTYGPHNQFGYKDFIPMFTAKRFDADEWMNLFKESGAKYVVPVAEHHDGFQMYQSELSHWNAKEMGPMRDVLGELERAAGKYSIKFGSSSHRVEHWFFMGHGREFNSDIKEPMQLGDFYWPAMKEPDHQDLFSEPAPSREFLEDWLLRCCELVDIASKNGTLLLNVGPKADGTIGEEDRRVLKEIGAWLKVNGEAIFGTTFWRKAQEGPTVVKEGQFSDAEDKVFTPEDIRFTVKGSALYATVLSYPEDGKIVIRSLAEADASRLAVFHGIVKDVDVLGFKEKPLWMRSEKGLEIRTQSVASDKPVVFKILLD